MDQILQDIDAPDFCTKLLLRVDRGEVSNEFAETAAPLVFQRAKHSSGIDANYLLCYLCLLYIANKDEEIFRITEILSGQKLDPLLKVKFRQFLQFNYSEKVIRESEKDSFQFSFSNNLRFSEGTEAIYVFSCDSHYFKTKFRVFHAGTVSNSRKSKYGVFLIIINPDKADLLLCRQYQKEGNFRFIPITSENIFTAIFNINMIQDDLYNQHCRQTYAIMRFLIIHDLMKRTLLPVVVLDSDLTFLECPEDYLGNIFSDSDFDVAIRFPERRLLPGADFWIHQSVYQPTPNGFLFSKYFKNLIIHNFKRGLGLWPLDQIAFNAVYCYLQKNSFDIKFKNIPYEPNIGRGLFHFGGSFGHLSS